MRKLLLLGAVVGGALAVLRRQQDRALDDAIWDEPVDLTPISQLEGPSTA